MHRVICLSSVGKNLAGKSIATKYLVVVFSSLRALVYMFIILISGFCCIELV